MKKANMTPADQGIAAATRDNQAAARIKKILTEYEITEHLKIETTRIDWQFKVNNAQVIIRWAFLEKRYHVGRMLPFYLVTAIFPNNENLALADRYETCLQVNQTNSLDYLKRILNIK